MPSLTAMRSNLLLLLLLPLLVGCHSSRRVVAVPLTHKVEERIERQTVEGDTTTLRLLFGERSDSLRLAVRGVSYQQGTQPTAPRLHWQVSDEGIDITAETPPLEVETKARVEYQEVPVEVEVTREVNRLYGWQKALMWCGGVVLLLLLIKVARKIINY